MGADPTRPGTLIGDTYRVVRPIGTGSMGIVVLARDERLDRDVAIKILRPELVSDKDLCAQFLVEARAMARVRHPNVVLIHAFGDHAGAPYFVMDYVKGVTVEQWIEQRGGLLAVDEALGLIDQICAGVDAIHGGGAVHGDIKSSNVIVGPQFQIKVADFGLARVLGPSENAPSWVGGTPEYMAPELLSTAAIPAELVPRRDVYALGVLAFELLTGRRPFTAINITEVITRHRTLPPPAPSDERADLPAELDGAVLAALEKDPARRTPSAAALRRALLDARRKVAEASVRPRIVIADDDPDFRAVVTSMLQKEFPRAEIVGVGDGAAALAALDARPPALAIIDIGMPSMNGIEVLAALRGNAKTAAIPVIAATAVGGTPELRAMSALGVNGFLLKPFEPSALFAHARAALR